MRHDVDVQRAVNLYQLGLPRMPSSGRTGDMLGRGTGSSLEFQEYREYLPGDDIRHLDWAAYGRSDALMVRLYREEISPQTEIFIDASRSMTTGNGVKRLVARQLAAMFSLMVGAVGGRPRLLILDDQHPLQTHGVEGLEILEPHPFNARCTLSEQLQNNLVPMKQQAVRIVISDFLFPHDPESLIRQLAANASTLWVIQLLTQFEADPTQLGGRRLIDIESRAEADLMLDRKTIDGYLTRLTRLQEALAQNCRRANATFVKLIADRGLLALCQQELSYAEIVRPA